MVLDSDGILVLLYTDVPEFKKIKSDFFDDSAMIQLGIFEWFLKDQLEKGGEEDLLTRGFNVFNEMAEFGTESVIDLLTMGVFSTMRGHGPNYVNKAKKYLSDKSIMWLDTVH
jgi:hypothetical protein